MSLPTAVSNAGIYTYTWEEEAVYIRLDRLDESSKDLSGEIVIRVADQHVHHSRFNLLSDIARDRLAATLSKRINGRDWYAMLEQARVMTLVKHREGESVKGVGCKPERMELAYQLRPILEKDKPTTIFAPGGTGKTKLADYIGCLVQFNYVGLANASQPWVAECGNVLYLDWESSWEDHARNVWAFKQGLGANDQETFLYRRCWQPLTADIHEIQRLCIEHQIVLVIIDSQVAAAGATESSSHAADVAYYNALRSLNVTSLTIDHTTKAGAGEGQHMPYGSVFKWNLSRSQFELQHQQEPGENVMRLALCHRKHNEGRLLKPIGIEFTFDYDEDILTAIRVEGCNIADIPGLVHNLSLRDQAINVLTRGPFTAAQLVKEMGLPKSKEASVYAMLNKWRDRQGGFIKLTDDRWGLRST